MSRSSHWRDVADVAERTRTQSADFDPEEDDPAACIHAGVEPIVTLFVRVRRSGDELSEVERSLLEGALNDWLGKYAACFDRPFDGGYTVREVAMAWVENGALEETVRELVGVDAEDPRVPAAAENGPSPGANPGPD